MRDPTRQRPSHLCASPAYLDEMGEPAHPDALLRHRIIAVTGVRPMPDRWNFGGGDGEFAVPVKPRLAMNTVQAALDAAVADGGLVRIMSYQSQTLEAAGKLRRVLAEFEPPPIPVQLVYPAGRYLPLKTRLFIGRATTALRGRFR